MDVAPEPDYEAAPSMGALGATLGQAARLSEPAPNLPAAGPAADAQMNMESWPVWDDGALARIVGNNPSAHARLLAKYRDSATLAMAELQSCAGAGDWVRAAAVAHKLKSSSRSVGAIRLGQLCEALEHSGNRDDAAACAALVPLVLAGFAAVEARI